MVFVNVSPLRNVIRFGSVGKLAPRFVGSFPITAQIGKVAYRVDLPNKLAGFHDVFHVSHLMKCIHDSAVVVEPDHLREVVVKRESLVRRTPTRILEHDIKRLCNKEVHLVKVQWGDDPRSAHRNLRREFKLLSFFI